MRNSIPPNVANFAVGELFGNVQTTHVDLCLSVGGGRGTVSWAPPSANQAGWQGRDCGLHSHRWNGEMPPAEEEEEG